MRVPGEVPEGRESLPASNHTAGANICSPSGKVKGCLAIAPTKVQYRQGPEPPKLKLRSRPATPGTAVRGLPTTPSREPSLSRFRRRVLFGVPAILVLLLIAGALAWHFGGATWVVNRILRGVNPYPGHTLAVARASGNPFGSLELDDVRLVRGDIGVLARLDSARIRYDPWQLLGDTIRIADVRVYGPWVDLRRLANSSWNLAVPRRPKVPSKPSNGPRIAIDHVVVAGGAGRISLDQETGRGLNLEAVNVEARRLAIAKGVRIDQATVRLRAQLRPRPLEWDTVEASGSLRPERIVVDSLQVRSPGSAISPGGRSPFPAPSTGLRASRFMSTRGRWRFATSLLRNAVRPPESAVLTLDARGEQPGIALRLSSIFSDSSQASVEGLVSVPASSPLAYISRHGIAQRRFLVGRQWQFCEVQHPWIIKTPLHDVGGVNDSAVLTGI